MSENYGADNEIELFGRKIRQPVIANTGYDKVSAEAELEKGIVKLISFGKLYISNPDLPERFEKMLGLLSGIDNNLWWWGTRL